MIKRMMIVAPIVLLTGCYHLREYHDCCQARLQASRAWKCSADCPVDGAYEGDFRDGWIRGYVDVAGGGSGEPPLLPPTKYRTTRYETIEGRNAASAWFEGFRFGALAAEADGVRELHYVPTSLTLSPATPSSEWGGPIAPESMPLPVPDESADDAQSVPPQPTETPAEETPAPATPPDDAPASVDAAPSPAKGPAVLLPPLAIPVDPVTSPFAPTPSAEESLPDPTGSKFQPADHGKTSSTDTEDPLPAAATAALPDDVISPAAAFFSPEDAGRVEIMVQEPVAAPVGGATAFTDADLSPEKAAAAHAQPVAVPLKPAVLAVDAVAFPVAAANSSKRFIGSAPDAVVISPGDAIFSPENAGRVEIILSPPATIHKAPPVCRPLETHDASGPALSAEPTGDER